MRGFIKGGIVGDMSRRDIPMRGRVVQTLCIVLIAAAVPAGWAQGIEKAAAGPSASNTALLYSGALYPPGMEWKSITTPYNRLIFPAGEEDAARQAAAAVTDSWGAVQEDFGIRLESYPLVVNTSLDITNGYFGLAPRKSEWYSYPSQTQFGGPADWYTLLALHEGRHAAQFSALDQGFIRWGRVLAGEYGWAGLSFYSIPLWYFEGDAILSETAFSGAGRGSTASFHREIRAIAEEGAGAFGAAADERDDTDGKEWAFPDYRQAYLGSYRRHFPSYYHLGYPLVTYIRMMYGGDAWNEILKETARFAFWPLRFHGAVKKITGRTVDQLYEDAMSFLSGYWSAQQGSEALGGFTYLTPEREIWTNYYPVAAGRDGTIYARVSGDDRAAGLVKLSPGGGAGPADETLQEERLFSFNARDGWIDVNGDRAVWAEQIPHPLWAKVSSSDLVVSDLDGSGRRRLTRGLHLQAPVFSPEGRYIAAIEVRPGGGSGLVFFDTEDGAQVNRAVPELDHLLPGPGRQELYLLHPAWSEDGTRVAVAGSFGGRSALLEYDPGEERWEVLYGPSDETIGCPRYWKDLLFYISDYSGREAIYVLDPASGERRLAAEGKYASVMPLTIDEGGGSKAASLIFADYGLRGFRLAAAPLDMDEFKPVPEAARGRINYAEDAAAQLITGLRASTETGAKLAETKEAAGHTAEIEAYHPAAHLLNFHSWGLLPTGEGRVELFARSDDPIGLLSLRTFAGFNPAGGSYDAGFQGVYRGTFPVVQFGLSGDINHSGDPDRQYLGFTGVFGLEAPVNLSRGIWRRSVSLGTDLFIRAEEAAPVDADGEMDLVLPIRHSLTLYNGSAAVSPKDFAPPWEQYSNWNWYYIPVQEEYSGWRLEQRGELIFPGLFRHHRIGVRLDAEWNEGEEIPLNLLPIRPRGYPFDWNDEYPGDMVAGLEYTLPLVSPDLAIGNIYYLKRVLLTLFSDVGIAGRKAEDFMRADTLDYYPSSGIELIGEQHLFNWLVSLQTGVRLIYRWRDATFRVETTFFTLGFEWK